MQPFQYTFYAQQIYFGPGSVNRLPEITKLFGWKRVMLCTSPSFKKRGQIDLIHKLLGGRLVATYDQVAAHVLEEQVREALELAIKEEVEALIALGGGSSVGMAKAVSHKLEEKVAERSAQMASPIEQPAIPIVAIPTTYAGSEMTPVYGVTRMVDGHRKKITVKQPKVTPKVVIYDPEWTLTLPRKVTAGTGINAVAHCIEALYSATRNPLSTACALEGLKRISASLLSCFHEGRDLEARTTMLEGAFLAGAALSNITMGLHHGICHVIGGMTGVSHGDANSVMLPYVMRFNMDHLAPEIALAAEAMGLKTGGLSAEGAAEAAVAKISQWIREMGLPIRWREMGIKEKDLDTLAENGFNNPTVRSNPKPITHLDQIKTLLREAW